jgi:large subunit ribosomal protein L4
VREERLAVVDALTVDQPKTKLLTEKLKAMGLTEVLIITDLPDENLYLSSRNLPNVLVLEARHADPVSLVRFPKVLLTRGAVKHLEEALA